jgi:hypothetical protein
VDSKDLEKDLQGILGERVTTSSFERWAYTKEIVRIPRVVGTLMQTVPDAVAKPETTEQVAKLLAYCGERRIPVTPGGRERAGSMVPCRRRAASSSTCATSMRFSMWIPPGSGSSHRWASRGGSWSGSCGGMA